MSFDYAIQTLPAASSSNRYHTVRQISDDVIYFNPDGANWVAFGALGGPKAHTLTSHSTRAHAELTAIGANDHHAQAHAIGGADHSGTLSHDVLADVSVDDHHAQLHEAAHVSGGGDAFTSAQLLEAIIKRIRESGGPTDLTVGAVADGEFLKRSGATVIGGSAGATVREQVEAVWTDQVTKTNIGTAYVDIYNAVAIGRPQFVDFAGMATFDAELIWDKVGTGTQAFRVVDADDVANVLFELANVVDGQNDAGGPTVLPAWATGKKRLKPQAKSTVAADDPIFFQCVVRLKP